MLAGRAVGCVAGLDILGYELLAAARQARTNGAVAGDGLPELSGSAPGLLSKLLSNAIRPR